MHKLGVQTQIHFQKRATRQRTCTSARRTSYNRSDMYGKRVNAMKNKINYVSWGAPGNLGDEALYKVDQAIFGKHGLELSRTSSTIEEKHSQITFISGGTCIPRITMWMKPTKYVYIFGAGVEDPLFYGPFDPMLVARLRRFDFRFIGVRGNISRALLKSWGIASDVIGDPCLSLEPNKVESKDNRKIAVNIGAAFSGGSWGSANRVLREVGKVCRILKKDGYKLVLIPFWTNNMSDINKLSKLADVNIFSDWSDIHATLQLISTCGILIGEKLHSSVFSAAANTPFICLAYAPEHFDFSESVGFSKYTIRTSEVTAEKIMALLDDLMSNYKKMQNELARKVNEYREKQMKFAARIVSDIESLPENKWAVQADRRARVFWGTDVFLHRRMSNVWKAWNKFFFLHVMRHLA